jgi:hypothetical protein
VRKRGVFTGSTPAKHAYNPNKVASPEKVFTGSALAKPKFMEYFSLRKKCIPNLQVYSKK